VGDLATLHPLKVAGNVAKCDPIARMDVGVGAAKGACKIAKSTGRGIGKLFHHHHDEAQSASAPQKAHDAISPGATRGTDSRR